MELFEEIKYQLLFGVVGVVGLIAAVPVFKVIRFAWNFTITRFSSADPNIAKLSNPNFFLSLFSPNGTKKLLEELVDKDGNIKHQIVDLGPHLDGKRAIGVTDAEAFREVLQVEKYPKLEIAYESAEPILGNGLVTSKGEVWKRQRRLLTPMFHFKNLSLMPQIMNSQILRIVDELLKLEGKEKIIYPTHLFSKMTLRIVIDCVFGGEEYFNADEMAPIWESINKSANFYFLTQMFFGNMNEWIPFPWNVTLLKGCKKVRNQIKYAIAKKREKLANTNGDENKNNADLLTSLLTVRDEETGKAIPDSLIIDEAITFLFAGHDTTSSLLSWAMTFLSEDKEVVQKIRDEVYSVVGDGVPSFDDLHKLNYCHLVAKETLRMRPPVPLLDRKAAFRSKLCGADIAANSYIYPIFIAAHYDNRHWEDPFKFNPDRFADSDSKRSPFAFVPFSANSRNCIGQKFALMEATLALAIIVSKFDIVAHTSEDEYEWELEGTLKPVKFKCSFEPL